MTRLSSPTTILNVDDREINRYTRSRVLRQAGFEVKEVATGSEALRMIQQDSPPIVLLDVNLPDINGLEVCRRIKSDPALASTLVLQISASLITSTDRARGLEGGADAYLVEPVDPVELVATVRALLRLQEAQQAFEQALERTTRLQNLTAALSKALTPAQVADVVIRQGLPGLGARAGSVTLLNEDRDRLQVIGSIGYPSEQIERWSVFPLTAPVPLADAVRLGQPILLSSPGEMQARYPHSTPNLLPGHLAWAAVPLIVEDRTLGAIGLSFAESRDFSPDELEFMLTLAGQCAQALERARLYEAEAWAREEAEVARLRLAFLAEAGKRLALSLDYETTLDQLKALIVPKLADQCFIDLVTEAGTLQRVLHIHADPKRLELAHEYERRYPPDPNRADHPVLQVIRTGKSILIPEINEALLQALARDAEQLTLARQLGMTSCIISPLTARGRTFGAISFIWAGLGRRYDPADLALAEDLTGRAALALDNARLYQQALTEITERQRAEALLQAAHQRISEILESIQDVFYSVDRDWRFTYVNQQAEAVWGKKRETLIGKQFWDVFPQAVGSHVYDQAQQAMEEQQVLHFETVSPILNTWIEIHLYPTADGGLSIYFRDISERKRTEEALRKSEEALRRSETALAQAGRMAHLGAWEMEFINAEDLNANPLHWSDEVFRIFGYEPGGVEVSNALFFERTHPADRTRIEKAIMRALAERQPYQIEHRIIRPDGVERIVLEYAETTFDRQGRPLRTLGAVQDITERRQAEEKVYSLARFPAEDPNPILRISREGVILYANLASRGLLESWQTSSGGRVPSAWEETIAHTLKTGKLKEIEVNIGSKIFAVICRPFPESGYVNLYGSDITARKQATLELQEARDAAEAASGAKSDFLARMSHELRTPLNAILGYTQILYRDRTLTSRQQEGIEIIHQSGEHLLHMINDILDMAKVEAGKLELYPGPLSLPRFLQILTKMVRVRAHQKGLTFTYQLDPALPNGVYVDEKRLREVLLNLLSNAIKYTRAGQVELTVAQISLPGKREVGVRFQVSDTGIGIAPETLENIFTPFYQGDDLAAQIEGTGLGLTISRRLVELLGGELQVKSRLDQGSVFWFDLFLPVVAVEELTLAQGDSAQAIVGFVGGPIKILIADDQRDNRLMLRELLSFLGFTVSEATNGREALDIVAAEPPDLILMDLIMPVMDGIQAIRHIRQRYSPEDMPIIAISASAGGNSRDLGQTAGADNFLGKPIRLEELFACLEKHLKLEWLYETLPAQEADEQVERPANLVPPPVEDLLALRALAQGGRMTDLEQLISKISQTDQVYQPFVEQMSRLVDRFEFEEIMTRMDQYLETRQT